MRRRIQFKRKRGEVANLTLLERHGKRGHIRNNNTQHLVPLNKKGKRASFKRGEELPKDLKLKLYFSPLKRNRQTAYHLYRGHKSIGGIAAKYRLAKRVGVRQELVMEGGVNIFLDFKFLTEETKRLSNNWDKLTENWVMGRYPSTKVVPVEKIGGDIIRQRLTLGRRATRRGRKGWLIMNVSHDTQIIAVLKVLLGKNPYSLSFKLPDYNKGLTIYHMKNGSDILEYGGKRFDVTRKLRKFM